MSDYRYEIAKKRQQAKLKTEATKILSFVENNPNCTISQIVEYFCIPCQKISFLLHYLTKRDKITSNRQGTEKILFWRAI